MDHVNKLLKDECPIQSKLYICLWIICLHTCCLPFACHDPGTCKKTHQCDSSPLCVCPRSAAAVITPALYCHERNKLRCWLSLLKQTHSKLYSNESCPTSVTPQCIPHSLNVLSTYDLHSNVVEYSKGDGMSSHNFII